MKKYVLIALLFLSQFLFAQTAEKWHQSIGGPGVDYGYSVKSCLDQGYAVAGSYASNGISDGYLVRTDSMGLIMWSKFYIGNNVDVLRSIIQLPDSGYILAGYSNSSGYGGYDGWVLRTDKNGDTLWTKYIGTPDWDFFYDVDTTYDGGFILAGGTYGLGQGDEDMYIVKLNSAGDTLWTKTYGGIKTDEARSICETRDSLLATCGFSYSLGDSLGDSWVLLMTSIGDTIWSRTTGVTNAEDKAWGIADCPVFNRIYFVGETSAAGNLNCYINSFTYSGTVALDYPLLHPLDDFFSDIAIRPNGTLAIIGSTLSYGAGMSDMYFYSDTPPLTVTTYGTSRDEKGYGIDFTHDGGYIACGYSEGFNMSVPNVYLVKMDSTGYSTGPVLSIREQPNTISGLASTVFPNPADQEATILFDVANQSIGNLMLTVFDISGREVLSVSNEHWLRSGPSSASIKIGTGHLSNGVYQYVISSKEGLTSSGKFVVTH